MSYDRRIICDLDDTISYTVSRDWKNAQPIQSVINKINMLHDLGWEIWIVTARGQLSCNGDVQAAEKKYREVIEDWLEKHGVQYDKLSFQKFLGSYYVDDKSLRPEEFVDLEIEVLKGESEANLIERRGSKVYKTASNSLEAANWYKKAQGIITVPKLYSIIGQTLCIDYIPHNINFHPDIDDLISIIRKFSKIPEYLPFKTYVDRLKRHQEATGLPVGQFLDYLVDNTYYYEMQQSFCHGDFSLDNVIQHKETKEVYLIDPIFPDNLYRSWLLDAGKLVHSLRRNGYEEQASYVLFQLSNSPRTEEMILAMEISQWIRLVKYLRTEEEKKNVSEYIINRIGEHLDVYREST